jgi:hypothetical protein
MDMLGIATIDLETAWCVLKDAPRRERLKEKLCLAMTGLPEYKIGPMIQEHASGADRPMATVAQIEANQANSLGSTGPRTPARKSVSVLFPPAEIGVPEIGVSSIFPCEKLNRHRFFPKIELTPVFPRRILEDVPHRCCEWR